MVGLDIDRRNRAESSKTPLRWSEAGKQHVEGIGDAHVVIRQQGDHFGDFGYEDCTRFVRDHDTRFASDFQRWMEARDGIGHILWCKERRGKTGRQGRQDTGLAI